MERAAAVEPPPELVTRILFEIPQARDSQRGGIRGLFSGWSVMRLFEPVLQPKFAMGMAMTILSFSMLAQFSGISVRQLRPSDLDPVKIVAAIDQQLYRGWQRAVQYYENLRVVYEIQTRLKEWTAEQDAAEGEGASSTAGPGAPQPSDQDNSNEVKGK
jgi:hypothetical protein